MRLVARRLGLLVVVVLAALVVGCSSAPQPKPTDAEVLALRLDAILDRLPERKLEPFDLVFWTYEIMPYFVYEGLTYKEAWPESVEWSLLPGFSAFHILGRAGCTREGGGPVHINARGALPTSPRSGELWMLGTLVHELVHIQGGGFCNGTSESLESTTQMATLEVLAAMANHGNVDAAYALIEDLRDMLMASLYYEALRDGEPERYWAFRDRVYSTPLEKARANKSMRRWFADKQSETNLREILNKYNYIPIKRVLEGLADECQCIKDLYLGPMIDFSRPDLQADPYRPRSLKLDDLAYFLEHLDEIAGQLAAAEPS